jgi:flagellar biosynthesis/type III secretory pathway chaperone
VKIWLEALEKNIRTEIEVQTGIQKLLDQQLDILLKGGVTKLTAVLANAEEGILHTRELEAERTRILARISEEIGVPAKELTLKKIEEHVGAMAATLVESGAELKVLIEKIREENRQVGLLLRHSVLFIEDLIRAVTGTGDAARTYGKDGSEDARSGGALLAEA